MVNWGYRAGVAVATSTLILGGLSPIAQAANTDAAEKPELLLVHGFGHKPSSFGKDCNGTDGDGEAGTWEHALDYFTHPDAGKMDRDLITTVGYYEGSGEDGENEGQCDHVLNKGKGYTNNERIQYIAEDLANYIYDEYTSKDRAVNIVAHSMGGLVTRVALLGTAQNWESYDFPKELNVNNVVTLGTPHQGLIKGANDDSPVQWRQMQPKSDFMARLRQKKSNLGDKWTKGTEWTVVGSTTDDTVGYTSAIDRGNTPDQKFGYKNEGDGRPDVTHGTIRTDTGPHTFNLAFWHKWGDEHQHHTPNKGWAPLKTAFKAATEKHDGLHEK